MCVLRVDDLSILAFRTHDEMLCAMVLPDGDRFASVTNQTAGDVSWNRTDIISLASGTPAVVSSFAGAPNFYCLDGRTFVQDDQGTARCTIRRMPTSEGESEAALSDLTAQSHVVLQLPPNAHVEVRTERLVRMPDGRGALKVGVDNSVGFATLFDLATGRAVGTMHFTAVFGDGPATQAHNKKRGSLVALTDAVVDGTGTYLYISVTHDESRVMRHPKRGPFDKRVTIRYAAKILLALGTSPAEPPGIRTLRRANAAVYDPAGQLLVSFGDNHLRRLDATHDVVQIGQPLTTVTEINEIALAADGARCALRDSEAVHIWHVARGARPRLECDLPKQFVRDGARNVDCDPNTVALSQHTGLVAVVINDNANVAAVFDAATGSPRFLCVVPRDARRKAPAKLTDDEMRTRLEYLQRGAYRPLEPGDDSGAEDWDDDDKTPGCDRLAFVHNDEFIVSAHNLGVLRLWDGTTGAHLCTQLERFGSATSGHFVYLSLHRAVVTYIVASSIKVYELDPDERQLRPRAMHDFPLAGVCNLAISADESTVVAACDDGFSVYDVRAPVALEEIVPALLVLRCRLGTVHEVCKSQWYLGISKDPRQLSVSPQGARVAVVTCGEWLSVWNVASSPDTPHPEPTSREYIDREFAPPAELPERSTPTCLASLFCNDAHQWLIVRGDPTALHADRNVSALDASAASNDSREQPASGQMRRLHTSGALPRFLFDCAIDEAALRDICGSGASKRGAHAVIRLPAELMVGDEFVVSESEPDSDAEPPAGPAASMHDSEAHAAE